MNKDKFYFKQIDIPYTDQEIQNLNRVFYKHTGMFVKLNNIEIVKLLVPSITKWFDSHNIEINQVFLISCHPGHEQDKHVDSREDQNSLALNILLTPGAKDSITRFYELKDPTIGPSLKMTLETNLPYYFYEDEKLEYVTHYNMHKPVLLNVQKIHSVLNNTPNNRAVLSFRFKKDPWFLVEDTI